jgi:hypothetical protein
MYTNEHMTLWRELISKYETSLLFTAEAAHQLVHIVQVHPTTPTPTPTLIPPPPQPHPLSPPYNARRLLHLNIQFIISSSCRTCAERSPGWSSRCARRCRAATTRGAFARISSGISPAHLLALVLCLSR